MGFGTKHIYDELRAREEISGLSPSTSCHWHFPQRAGYKWADRPNHLFQIFHLVNDIKGGIS